MKAATRAMAVAAMAAAAAWAAPARADFILTGVDHLDINSAHSLGYLYEQSSADALAGGYVYDMNTFDQSLLRVAEAPTGTRNVNLLSLRGYGASRVEVLNGRVEYLWGFDQSRVRVAGGRVPSLFARHNSTLEIVGGEVTSLVLHHDSVTAIRGGQVHAVEMHSHAALDLWGGRVDLMAIEGYSQVTFHGHDFAASDGLVIDGDVVRGVGVLSGRWSDSTAWTTAIMGNDPLSTVRLSVVPEPATAGLLAAGLAGFGVLAVRRRMRAGEPARAK